MFTEKISKIVRENEPLGPYCWLGIGGPARFFAEPSSLEELRLICGEAASQGISVRILGGGSNLLIRRAGVDGLVLRLVGQLAAVKKHGTRLVAGGGASLGDVISFAAESGLAGLEHLAGIPGSLGGAVVSNSGVTNDDIGSRVMLVRAVSKEGQVVELDRTALQFGFRRSNLQDVVISEVEFDLEPADPLEITRRLQAAWIVKKASQPQTGTRAAQAFIEPSGSSIAELIDAAGMRTAAEGEAAMSSQFPGYLAVTENVDAEEVLTLTARISRAVEVQTGIQLRPQLKIW